MSTLKEKLQYIYNKVNLNTVCCRQCTCCRVACPQMKYSEAVNIIQGIWETWSVEDRKRLIVTCIRYFFSKSLIKPCPLLYGNICKIYEDRPINCRFYGLWPKDTYERRVKSLAKILSLPLDKIPLNKQCPFVELKDVPCKDCFATGIKDGQECAACNGKKIVSPAPLTDEDTNRIFSMLDSLDKETGKLTDEQIAAYWNYRTLHDWILFVFFGEKWLLAMTHYAIKSKQQDIDAFLEVVEAEVMKMDFSKMKIEGQGE